MIVISNRPLSAPQAKEIQDWLMMPAARLFQEHIANKAAEACAHAGNYLASDELYEGEEATKHANVAKAFGIANKVIDEIRNSSNLQVAELRSEMKIIETVKQSTS